MTSRQPLPHRFHKAARQGCYVYAYIRRKTSEQGQEGTPYYIGIAKDPRRPFRNKSRPVSPPTDRKFVKVIKRRLSWEEAGEWEKRFIAHYKLAKDGGLLRNNNYGGAGTSGASEHVRQAASQRMRALQQTPAFRNAVEAGRRNPDTTRKKSDAAKAYFSQPGKVKEMADRQKQVMNKPSTVEKCRLAQIARYDRRLKELGMTREEYEQTPRGKAAAASRRYKDRLLLKRALEAS